MNITEPLNQFGLRYGGPVQVAFQNLLTAMNTDFASPFSAEDFAVKFLEAFTAAEKSLPDAQKQNNFGYAISEGGAYRGSIKAAVSTNLTVVG